MTALQMWRVSLPCVFGMPTLWGSIYAVGWSGPDHCLWCSLEQGREKRRC